MERTLRLLKALANIDKCPTCNQDGLPRLTPGNLPGELIILIMEHANCDIYSLIRYSHVCSRLRSVILGTSSIWASITLDTKLPASLIDAIARRSGDLGLTVHVYVPHPNSNCSKDTLHEIFKHCRQWKTAFLCVDDYFAEYLQMHFPLSDFPRLRALRMVSYWSTFETPCYRGWSFTQLNELSLRMRGCTVADITTLLASTPRLTCLDVDVSGMKASAGSENRVTATLPLLQHLRITSQYSERGALGSLLGIITCPSLRCLSFMLLANSSDYNDVVSDDTRRRYPLLLNFFLYLIFNQTSTTSDVFFEDILNAMPTTIERIKIETYRRVNFRITRAPGTDHPAFRRLTYPNLQDVRLECEVSPEIDFSSDLSILFRNTSVKLRCYRSNRPMGGSRSAEVALKSAGVLVDPSEVELLVALTPLTCKC